MKRLHQAHLLQLPLMRLGLMMNLEMMTSLLVQSSSPKDLEVKIQVQVKVSWVWIVL